MVAMKNGDRAELELPLDVYEDAEVGERAIEL